MCSATSLHSALCEGKWKLEDIEKLLQRETSSVNEKNFESSTPLISVLKNKNCSADLVKLLLRYGADVNYEDRWYKTPLFVALSRSRGDAVVMALIENGANVHVSGLDRSYLCIALGCGASTNVIQMLLDKGCSLNACKFHDGSVLHCVTDPRSVINSDVLQMLIGRGADIKAVDSEGRSVMCFALQGGHEAHSIEMLLEAGGSLNGCPIHASPFLCATDVICDTLPLKASVVQLLLKAGACVDTVNAKGQTPLQCTLENCPYEREAITMLLDCYKGVDLNSLVDKENNSLLHLAVGSFDCIPSIVKLLIKRGVEVDKVKKGGTAELCEAVYLGNPKYLPSIIKTLLQNGAKVNNKMVSVSVRQCHAEVVKVLLASGASITEASFNSLLEMVLRQCSDNQAGLACFKLLAKYHFLKASDYKMCYLCPYHKNYQDLRRFGDQCVSEVFKLQSKVSYPLYKFLIGSTSPYEDAADQQTEDKMCNFDRLLEIIGMDSFPLYFDVISERIGSPLMETKLQEIFVYATKHSPDNAHVPEKIVLHYYDVLEIAQYLTNEDLLRFILAFHNADGCVSNAQDIKGKKRAVEEPNLHCKHPKLCKK